MYWPLCTVHGFTQPAIEIGSNATEPAGQKKSGAGSDQHLTVMHACTGKQ